MNIKRLFFIHDLNDANFIQFRIFVNNFLLILCLFQLRSEVNLMMMRFDRLAFPWTTRLSLFLFELILCWNFSLGIIFGEFFDFLVGIFYFLLELLDKIEYVFEIIYGFPGIVSMGIAYPLDLIFSPSCYDSLNKKWITFLMMRSASYSFEVVVSDFFLLLTMV